MIPFINLTAFIQQNAAYLTLTDMAEETGESIHVIRNTCQKLNITPIKMKDQAIQYIRQFHTVKEPSQIAKAMGCGLARLRQLYQELKLPFKKEEKPGEGVTTPSGSPTASATNGQSVRQILGTYQHSLSIHYTDTPGPQTE